VDDPAILGVRRQPDTGQFIHIVIYSLHSIAAVKSAASGARHRFSNSWRSGLAVEQPPQ
jgi:hypothetical protein